MDLLKMQERGMKTINSSDGNIVTAATKKYRSKLRKDIRVHTEDRYEMEHFVSS
jgi:alpha-acetolactate decarboxylase